MLSRFSRRAFCAAGVAWGAGRAWGANAGADLPVVDTHQHLWDLDKIPPPWIDRKSKDPLSRSFVSSDYIDATRGLNVVQAVYMEVDVGPAQRQAEVDYVTEICRRGDTPMRAAVVGGLPGEEGFAAYAKSLAKNEYVKGVRQVLHGGLPKGSCLTAKFVRDVQLLGELGLRFDLCMRPGELGDGVKLVEQAPKTRFVLDHCGNMPVQSNDAALRASWEKSIVALAALPNVVAKISGIVAGAPEGWMPRDLASVVNFTLNAFGEDRVMFAGDWPVCTRRATFAQWLNALKTLVSDRSVAFQRKLFAENAVRFYGLKPLATNG